MDAAEVQSIGMQYADVMKWSRRRRFVVCVEILQIGSSDFIVKGMWISKLSSLGSSSYRLTNP